MKMQVRLTRVSDGKVTEFTEHEHHKCEDCGSCMRGAEFRWSEGNESCDCNRASHFEDEPTHQDCTSGRFTCEIKLPGMADFMDVDKVYVWLENR